MVHRVVMLTLLQSIPKVLDHVALVFAERIVITLSPTQTLQSPADIPRLQRVRDMRVKFPQ